MLRQIVEYYRVRIVNECKKFSHYSIILYLCPDIGLDAGGLVINWIYSLIYNKTQNYDFLQGFGSCEHSRDVQEGY